MTPCDFGLSKKGCFCAMYIATQLDLLLFRCSEIELFGHIFDISTPSTRKSHAETKASDENSVSFQMFLILLSFITLVSESQSSVFKQLNVKAIVRCLGFFFGGGGVGNAQKPKFFWMNATHVRHRVH